MQKFLTKNGALYFGSNPTDEEYEELKANNISVVWNLGAELTIEADLEREFADVVFSPIDDGYIPNIDSFMSDLESVLNKIADGEKLFVHCLHGKGRTGLALSSLSMVLDGLGPKEAMDKAKAHCGGPEKKVQVAFIYAVAKIIKRIH